MEGLNQQGLASCPQASLTSFPEIIKKHISMPEELSPIFGLSIGYEDKSASVNDFRTEKLPLEDFCHWQ